MTAMNSTDREKKTGLIPPFKLEPVFKDYIWGGTKLKTQYGKNSELPIIAESWELSAHGAGSSVIADGEYKGMSFADFIAVHPETRGTRCAADRFPILVKLIDSAQHLSIQVHPGDDYALRCEGEPGKTEMWVVMDSEPGAFLYFGFKRELTRGEFERRISDGSLTEILEKVPVRRGDVFFIPAGTIHAIGAGITLAEIQQNSDSTYRVFDFGRLGADGKPRPLHIGKALDVTSLGSASFAAPGQKLLRDSDGVRLEALARCEKFTVDRLTLNGSYQREVSGESFLSLLCLDGSFSVDGAALAKGECMYIPANTGSVTLSGDGELLLIGI